MCAAAARCSRSRISSVVGVAVEDRFIVRDERPPTSAPSSTRSASTASSVRRRAAAARRWRRAQRAVERQDLADQLIAIARVADIGGGFVDIAEQSFADGYVRVRDAPPNDDPDVSANARGAGSCRERTALAVCPLALRHQHALFQPFGEVAGVGRRVSGRGALTFGDERFDDGRIDARPQAGVEYRSTNQVVGQRAGAACLRANRPRTCSG